MEDRIVLKRRITGWLGVILILLGCCGLVGCPTLTERISSKDAVGQTYPAFLDFGSSLSTLSFKLSNVGSGDFYWTAKLDPADASDWLSLSSTSGYGSASLTATVDRSKLTDSAKASIRICWASKETTVDVVCAPHEGGATTSGVTLLSPTASETYLVPFDLSWKVITADTSDLAYVITADGSKYAYGEILTNNTVTISAAAWSQIAAYLGTAESGVFHWGLAKKSTLGANKSLSTATLHANLMPFRVSVPASPEPTYAWTEYWPLVVNQQQAYYWQYADPQGGATSYTLAQNTVDAITVQNDLTIYQVSTYIESDCSLFLESAQTITAYYVAIGDWVYRTTDSTLLDELPDITKFERRFPINLKPQAVSASMRLEAGPLAQFAQVTSYWPDLSAAPYSLGLYDVFGYDTMTDCVSLSYKRSNGEWQPAFVFAKGQGIVINTMMSGDQSLMVPLPFLNSSTVTAK